MNILPNSPSWASIGSIWPLGIPVSQSWLDIGMVLRIIYEKKIQFVFEIGVHHGGMAQLLLSYPGLDYAGVEIKEDIIDSRVKSDNIKVGDAWSKEMLDFVKQKIDSHEGPCLILCDGGNKVKDLRHYMPLLRKGDFIACHDYYKEVFFEDVIVYFDVVEPFSPDWVKDTNWFVMGKVMKTFDDIPEEKWLEELNSISDWNKRHMLSIFSMFGFPSSMLDVGCGDGTMVRTANTLGVKAHGIDQLASTEQENFTHWNLVDKFALPDPVDMVICLEVAEHLHPSAHATLCDTCADNLSEGREKFLIFSAAFPNQGGIGHVSERPSKYWMDEFSLRKLNYRKDLTCRLSLLWSNIGSPLYWLAANVLVFEK